MFKIILLAFKIVALDGFVFSLMRFMIIPFLTIFLNLRLLTMLKIIFLAFSIYICLRIIPLLTSFLNRLRRTIFRIIYLAFLMVALDGFVCSLMRFMIIPFLTIFLNLRRLTMLKIIFLALSI